MKMCILDFNYQLSHYYTKKGILQYAKYHTHKCITIQRLLLPKKKKIGWALKSNLGEIKISGTYHFLTELLPIKRQETDKMMHANWITSFFFTSFSCYMH